MKKSIYLFALLFSISLSAQELFWYDVILDVEFKDTNEFERIVDNFYSNKDFSEGVSMTFSRIPLKGQGFDGTHILSFVATSSELLAAFRGSLSGDKWDNYMDLVWPYIVKARSSAGNVMQSYNMESINPIGQAWMFKIKSKNVPAFASAFETLMQTFEFTGFVGLAQLTHGSSNGENIAIYGTYEDLNSAFNFGPKSNSESKAFADFSKATADISEFTQTWTRVEIKTYK